MLMPIEKNGRYGAADDSGNIVIPCVWDKMGEFSCDLAAVKQDGKWGYIDPSGELVIPCQWDEAEEFKDYTSEDYAAVRLGDKWGLIDTDGKLIIPCEWELISYSVGNGGLIVTDESGDDYDYDGDAQKVKRPACLSELDALQLQGYNF